MEVARRIGNIKIASKMDIRDPDIEAKILEKMQKRAAELKLPQELIEELFKGLIGNSVQEQKRLNSEMAERKRIGKCTIYGGGGGMGRLLAELLQMRGYDICVIRSSGAIQSFPQLEDIECSIADSDFSIVSVPMSLTSEVIKRAAMEIPGKRVYEICSMKDHLKGAISEAEREGAKVISLHPMFGPRIGSFRNLPVLFCGEKQQFAEDPLWKAFEAVGSKLLTIPVEKHDLLMTYILQLTHGVNIIYLTVLSNSGIDLEELNMAASPICRQQLKNARAVAQQDPKLYFEIQRLSGHLDELYDQIEKAERMLRDALKEESSTKFKSLMGIGKEYFKGG